MIRAVLREYFQHVRTISVSLVFAIPLLVVYELGILVVGWQALNGADLLTIELLRQVGRDGFITFNLLLLAGFGIATLYLGRKKRLRLRWFVPLLAESALYAVMMGSVIIFTMQQIYLLAAANPRETTALTRIVISAGAGLHEELVFRLAMIPAITWLWAHIPKLGGRRLAAPVALVVSSVLFSLAHFMVDPFEWFAFWYRTFAGLIFGMLFWWRGFAVAVYTHALYDVYVLLLR